MAATFAWPFHRVARGNGKTGLIAGLVCCHMFGPEAEPRGEIYCAACSTKQAALVFAEVEAIIRAVPEFKQFRIKATLVLEDAWRWGLALARAPSTPCCRAIRKPLTAWRRRLWIYDELGHCTQPAIA